MKTKDSEDETETELTQEIRVKPQLREGKHN
jgi:hypothetical protein